MKPADFRSDTVTQPTSGMRAAMAAAPLGDDVFGDDPTVNELQRYAADLLGFDAAIYAPTGTMANLMAMMSHCQRGDEVICGQMAHTYRWEAGGMAVLGSIQPQPLAHEADGTLALAAIEAAIKPDDPHFAKTRLICLENTIGGKVISETYMGHVRALARSRGLLMHLDGARLFNAATALAADHEGDVYKAARAITSNFDSVSVCLSKGLGAPMGSVLLGSHELITRAKRVRKMLGGGMRQAGVVAAAGLYALKHQVVRLADDHARLGRLASGMQQVAAQNAALAGKLAVESANTNMVFTTVASDIAAALAAHLRTHAVNLTASSYTGGARQRWVTHLDIDDADITRTLSVLASFR
jgi:threonine aldolase